MIFKNIITICAIILCISSSICWANIPQSNSGAILREDVIIENPWARPSMSTNTSKNNNSAIYLEIVNNSTMDYNLINVNSDIANMVELHKSFVDEKGVSKMVRVDKLAVPAKSRVILEPGGTHIMLLDLRRILTVGEKFDLYLYFDNGLQKVVQVEVKTK